MDAPLPRSDTAPAGAAPALRECDVLVVGGGPAGSTVAALLARQGWRVTLIEKARHPRFHIGESLLPANLPLLDKLGVLGEVQGLGMEKWGAEFISPWHEPSSQTVRFAEAWDKSMPYAYQVRRSEFDEVLLRNAQRKGAEVIEGCRVRDVAFRPDGSGAEVEARHDDGRTEHWNARFVVDASGRDTVLGKKFGTKRRNPRHNSSAVYAHFTGARRHEGQAEGNITIFWFEHGWFWFIPLADGCTSIGAVVWPYYLQSRGKPLDQFFLDTIALCPALAARLEGATLASEVEATGNFSYSCDQTHGPGYLMIGDAYAFIDPVFSSGVMLAMHGGFVAADTVTACLREPARAAQALRRFDKEVRRGPREFSWFIYRVTNPIMRDMLMTPSNVFRVKEALLSMLAGDIFGRTPIWGSLRALKAIYYLLSLAGLRRSWQAMRRRRANIQPNETTDALAG
ncbi:Dehydrogenase (flavoproteins)-like protein [Ramlibacter tataouinensis TTB310]|uniref:Dehydrogenase (Flavoproteins)-like protein n=1 Tax=Ramlibacter tataouinensis (strain ATCC BAA-407 / DSM 14655 / LMG 21543 / TTB310) TaxID=365046 RepID=F5Y4L5_RAMTT|nr:Dehydrogenase (flavoproteins)-like protein [Ramlibacter tataouinensis TTB310]